MRNVLRSVPLAQTPAAAAAGRPTFTDILLERGLVSRNDLNIAEQHAAREKLELAEALIVLALVPENDCYAALARAAGLSLIDLAGTEASELAVRLVPEKLARRHVVVPLAVDNRTLTYATFRPFDPEAERDLAFASGRRTQAVLASRNGVLDTLERCYPKLRELDVLAARLSAERPNVEHDEADKGRLADSPVVDLCDHIIGRAVEVGASDVHVECGAQGTTVRYRICGVLEPVLSLPASVSQPIRNRFKIMGRADIAIRHRPQDGAFKLKVNGRPIDVRLSTLPTVDGEKIVLRVIDSVSPLQTLERCAYDKDTLSRLEKSLSRPDGLILVTGPTGSGKTTALYAALNHLRTGRTNIVTVEDPVERTVAGVTQIPVNAGAGSTFATVLRSMLRQDPNVIMVGEIRDEEVAQIVGQAAYTGHLVLSSMHTADAATAVTRLADLGLEPYKIAESLSAVLSQRLLRSLCPGCRRQNDPQEAARLGAFHNLPTVPMSAGAGCPHCNQTGYFGRLPVAELLTPTDQLRDAIARGATTHEIRTGMRAAGCATMRDRALELVAQGITSIEEVNRVLSAELTQVRTGPKTEARVLITDDDPITRMLVKILLERENYEVIEATNGREAVEIATRERPDLLLIDLNMPEVDGYEAIARLRKDFSMTTLPIVVLTAEDSPGIEQRVLQLGADDFILKPFEAPALLSRVHAVFRRLKVDAAA